MIRQDWKDLLESVGLVAIIASLVFVGIETRNSTEQAVLTNRALEIAAYQELMDNISEMNRLQLQDAELSAIVMKSLKSPDDLTELEQYRMNRAYFMRLRHGDMAFFQYERGAIDSDRLASAMKIVQLGLPQMRNFWRHNQQSFVENYRHHVNGLIDEIEAGTE